MKKNKNIMLLLILLSLILTLTIGCISSNDTVEPTVVPIETTVVPIETTVVPIETTVVPIETTVVQTQDRYRIGDFVGYTFNVNDEKVILDRNIRLKELATEEGTAIINVDGDPYKLTYNIEQEIKGRIIKIVDIDGINNTVKIMVRSI